MTSGKMASSVRILQADLTVTDSRFRNSFPTSRLDASIGEMALPLETFQHLPVRNVDAGEIVIEQGTRTGRLFILIEGKVEIVKGEEIVATSGQPGDLFGDISALLDLPHTTTVRAARASRFYVIAEARPFLEQNPIVCMHLCELLATRLVSVTSYLADLKHQFAGHDHIGMVDEVLDRLIHRHPRARVAPSASTIRRSEIAD
jgi:CRP/FNR family transcriptional regulator, cyclic AMP receptor protein